MPEEILTEAERRFDEEAAELEPCDACAWLGRPFRSRSVYEDAPALRAALAAGPIRRALVSHTMGELYDPAHGNDALAEALTELPGLHGVMTLLPPAWDDPEEMGAYIDRNLARGLRAARIHPKSHRYSLRIPTIRTLLAALQERRVPLFIPIAQTSWDEIGPLAQAWPDLPILVESPGHHEYLNMRHALPWLEAAPNLHVPTNRQFLCGGIELLVERIGADRILFASNQPIDDPYAALGPLVFSDLPLSVRRRIAHENIDRLLAAAGNGRAQS